VSGEYISERNKKSIHVYISSRNFFFTGLIKRFVKHSPSGDLNFKSTITSALYFCRHQQTEIPSSTLPSFPIDWPDLTSHMQKAPPLTYSFGVQVD
jgi:hypothetical protein